MLALEGSPLRLLVFHICENLVITPDALWDRSAGYRPFQASLLSHHSHVAIKSPKNHNSRCRTKRKSFYVGLRLASSERFNLVRFELKAIPLFRDPCSALNELINRKNARKQ